MSNKKSQKRILIPVEIKSRELSAKLLLATVLADRGHDVYLGNKLQHTVLDRVDPDVYFELNGKDHEVRLQRLKEHGVQTLVLETEGAAFNGKEDFSRLLGAETLEHTDCYCAWGTVAAESVNDVSPTTRVETTGNPRFDLLQKPFRTLYKPAADEIEEQYGDFILFNTNFAIPLGETSPAEKFSNFSEDDPNTSFLYDALNQQTKILGEFLRLIAETAEAFPERQIILRAHPSTDPSLYANCFYAYDNVAVTRKLEARPWIMAAEVVVHNSCTTGLTSALLGTPVVAYIPDELELYQGDARSDSLSLPNHVSDQCRTISDVHEFIDEYLSGERTYALDEGRVAKVKKHINNYDYLSSERIADIVDSLVVDESERTPLPVDNTLRLRRGLVRAFGQERFERLYVKRLRGENRDKFPYTTTEEVEDIVDRFPDEIKPADLQIERLPYAVNGFRVRRGS